VVCSRPHEDWEQIAETYTYNDAALRFPEWNGKRFPKPVSEMVTTARTLGSIGVKNASLRSKEPPNADLFVDADEIGAVAAEITIGVGTEDVRNRVELEQFLQFLNDAAATEPRLTPYAVNLAFNECPKQSEFEALATAIILEAIANRNSIGVQRPSGPLSAQIAQYFINHRPSQDEEPIFGGGFTANFYGLPDAYNLTLDMVEEKKRKDYREKDRDSWLIVEMRLHLTDNPTIEALYQTDLDLGRFQRIILSNPSVIIDFRRADSNCDLQPNDASDS
jgi:hypothetical protein